MPQSAVSVVMATYNRQELLKAAVDSIRNQSFDDFEFIIVDDCSTDHTASILQEFAKRDGRIRILRTSENSGCNIARNLAIDSASGKYIAIMDDDDISVPERLASEVKYLEQHPGTGLVGSTARLLPDKVTRSSLLPPKYIADKIPDSPERIFEDVYLGKYVIPNPTLMIRSEILKANKYPEVRYNGADVTLFLKLAALGVKMHFMTEPLLMIRRGASHRQMTFSLEQVHRGRKRTIRDIRRWLSARGIIKSETLHKKALRNVLARRNIELAISKSKIKGLPIYFRALGLSLRFTLFRTRVHLVQRMSRRRYGKR